MSLHPDLVSFQRRLEAAGVVAAVHADHLCVRLPLLASVRIRYDGARLAFDPRSGAASRTTTTISALVGSVSGIAALIASGVSVPYIIGAGVAAALGSGFDIMRYVVTESAITRVAMLWAVRGAAEPIAALGEGPAQPVHAAHVGETLRAPRHVQ